MKIKNVKELPVVVPEKEKQKSIIELVNGILTVKRDDLSGNVADKEKEIDHLVYQLYGLMEAEIATIENRT